MSDVFVPFNFQPESTTVKAGADTVPAGKYWHVKNYTSDFSIDGSDAFQPAVKTDQTTPVVNVGTGSQSFDYPINADGYLEYVKLTGTATISTNNTVTLTYIGSSGDEQLVQFDMQGVGIGSKSEDAKVSLRVFQGDTLRITISYTPATAAGGNQNARVEANVKADTGQHDIWLAAGTATNGSSYVVTQYQGLV
jgi:hypothetical protein